jgi:hypothetical protein
VTLLTVFAYVGYTQLSIFIIQPGGVLAVVSRSDTVITRLPYSDALYVWSTGGACYDRWSLTG